MSPEALVPDSEILSAVVETQAAPPPCCHSPADAPTLFKDRHMQALVKQVAPKLAGRSETCSDGCHTALETAIITAPDARDPAMVEKLDAVAGRVLGG